MNSEKVKEIKKIADFCIERGANCGCCAKEKETDSMLTCRSLMKELLTLINELESELKEEQISSFNCNTLLQLTEKENQQLKSENEWLVGKVKEKVNEMTTYTVNNQQLKDRIAELEKENDEQYKRIMELEQDLVHADENVFYRECDVALQENKIKTEALKQFAKRLKEKFNDTEYRAKTKRKTISVEELKAQMDWILHEVVIKNIDETLKEFINKGDEER